MKKNGKGREERLLARLFAAVTFAILFVTLLISLITVYFLGEAGILIGPSNSFKGLFRALLSVFVVSNIIGMILSYFVSRIPAKPIEYAISKINQLADGNFKVRLHYSGIIARHPDMRGLANSFNKLAEELESTEMLRTDFVNNFSHEFKTPIVSITGFAKLLKKGNLTEKQKEEYLDIIEKESMRLSDMATNVLNLTKIENQAILTDSSKYNLSEQIRDCILLLVDKWEKKNIEMDLEFGEVEINANRELMSQVWINLIDNAIKFSPEWGSVRITIESERDEVRVSVTNTGESIPEDKLGRIFNKFYQADESHAASGNGIGLAIVKKVVDLHGGRIQVKSENSINTFIIILPAD